MASIKGFLTNYFKQLHFNSMPAEVRARWEEYLKMPDLNNSMKDWRSKLMYETTNPDGTKVYTNKNLPDIEKSTDPVTGGDNGGLEYDQIEELYKGMNDAISGMAEDKRLDNAEYAAAKTFVKDFYGDGKVFHIINLKDKTCDNLTDFFATEPSKSLLKPILEIKGVLPEGLSYDDLISGIQDGKTYADKKYNKDASFRAKLKDVIRALQSAKYTYNLADEQIQLIEKITKLDLDPNPTKEDVNAFKANLKKANDDNVLWRLYKKSKAKELFANHDDNGIAAALDTARNEVDYDKTDSPNFLYPKTEKHLNFPQTVKDKWDKFYENRLAKWHNFGGDYMFQSRAAEDIVKAIKKEKIKPTDGLDAILNNAEKIKGDMAHTGNQTGKHFEWFLKEMKAVKDKDKDAFNACLFSGVSLRAVVKRVIRDAINDGKIAEAKTALEILSVIKYENTTSKIVDNLEAHFKENPQGILNNKDLSFNKNEGVQFVTNALTKTLRVGVIVVAKIATIAVNTVRKSGSKIKDGWMGEGDDLEKAVKGSESRKKDAQKNFNIFNPTAVTNNYTTSETDYNNVKQDTDFQANLDLVRDFITKKSGTTEQIKAAEEFLDNVEKYISGKAESIEPGPALAVAGIKTPVSDIVAFVKDTPFQEARQKWKDANKAKTDYENAAKRLKAATAELEADEIAMKYWNENQKKRYDELVKYWNDLEYGRDMHLGRMFGGHYSHFGSKKTQQALHYQMFHNGMTRAA